MSLGLADRQRDRQAGHRDLQQCECWLCQRKTTSHAHGPRESCEVSQEQGGCVKGCQVKQRGDTCHCSSAGQQGGTGVLG